MAGPKHRYGSTARNSEVGKICTDRIGDVARSKMGVMLLRHTCVGVAELRGNDAHRHAAHGKRRTVRMTEDMETDRRGNAGSAACLDKGALLMRGPPRPAIAAVEYERVARAAGCKGVEQSVPFIRQHHVTLLSSL